MKGKKGRGGRGQVFVFEGEEKNLPRHTEEKKRQKKKKGKKARSSTFLIISTKGKEEKKRDSSLACRSRGTNPEKRATFPKTAGKGRKGGKGLPHRREKKRERGLSHGEENLREKGGMHRIRKGEKKRRKKREEHF